MTPDPAQDNLAFELAGHLDFVRRLARSLVRDEQLADDVVQETMLAAVARRPAPEAGLRAWLAGVLRRRVLLHFRSEQRRVARETLMLRDAGETASRSSAGVEQAMLSLERSSMVGRAVAQLGEPYREVIVLRYLEGLPPREIAKRLERPIATVRTQLQRGLERLRRDLDASHGGDRRAWVVALLPHAIHGTRGFWPRSVRGVAGVSHGALAVAAAALVGAVGALLAAWPDRGAEGRDRVAVEASALPGAAAGELVPSPPAPPERSPAPVADPGPTAQAAGVLALTVRDGDGPIPNAEILARQEDAESRRFARLKSVVRGPNGYRLEVGSGGMRVEVEGEGSETPEVVTAVTDDAGVARIRVLDGRRWRVQALADGFAAGELVVQELAPRAGRSIRLLRANRVEIDRGAFPLESNVFVRIDSPFDDEPDSGVLRAGLQELLLTQVEPGLHVLEALSARGNEVALWYVPLEVEPEAVARVDLTMGGDGRVQIDVRGGDPGASAHFVLVHGPDAAPGRPLWRRVAPVHDGLADLRGLPAGPARVEVLSRDSEIGGASFEIAKGPSEQRVRVDIATGGLRVVHRGLDRDDLEWRLERRSDGPGAQDRWTPLGLPLPGEGESRFHGLEGGEYRLRVTGGGLALERTLTLEDGEVAELDLWIGAADEDGPAPVEIVRGAGLANGAPLQVEVAPGEWESLAPEDAVVRLSPGVHRLRIALSGVGFAIREVDVPRVGRVAFAQESPPHPFTVQCSPTGEPRELRVAEDDGRGLLRSLRSVPLTVDAGGAGVLALRPGRYVVSDRWGRRAALEVRPGVATVRIELE